MSLIQVEDLVFRYPDGTLALDGITLTIKEREFVAFIGQNGSGKTTLSKCLTGLLRPTRGRVTVDGVDTSRKGTTKDLVRRIGYVFQNPDHQLFNSQVYEEISYGPKNLGVPLAQRDVIVREAAAAAGVRAELFSEHPFFLSKGLRQRVAIASTLAMRPQAIVVDEPTTGQDYRQSLDVMDFLLRLWREDGHTVIIVTHEMPIVAAYAQRVVVLCRGRVLIDGPTREVFGRVDLLADTFVKPPQVTRLAQAWAGMGVRADALTVDELVAELDRVLAGRREAVGGRDARGRTREHGSSLGSNG
jgi:energy-coupling factor transport system ATP-binding protein